MNKKRWIAPLLEIALGVGLMIGGWMGLVDEYYAGMGLGLTLVGVVFFLRQLRYHRNPDYKEQVDVAANDERNRFLAMKAWSWAGYLYVMATGIAVIVCVVTGQRDWSVALSLSMCVIICFYWISYMILKRKY